MSNDVSVSSVGTVDVASTLGSDYRRQLAVELEPARLIRFVVILLEFALVVAAIRLLNIESNSFESVLTMALAGFVVNHFLPAQWRHTFFAGLSLASVLLVFGMLQGAWLLMLGVVLIALCHLPVPFRIRIVLVLLAATAMAFERVGMIPIGPSVPGTIWPILGAMFMFRLFTYMYDLAHKSAPFSPVRAVSYFFMLPNVCFPLFPVVDYKTLQRSIYNDDALKLYQTGVKWMLRGVVHLALYKVVYFLAVVDPSEVATGTGAARYMVSTYLLYLKISGLFHLIIGLLRMFGFGLAETHHFYLFASSFTDFWRRINIYWKDFIQKLVFNPIYFATRKLGATGSLVVATLVAFTATWLFHSYQWFWIRGTFPIVWSDLVFWFGLGVVVMFNVLIETRLGRRRSLGGKDVRSVKQDVIHGLKIAGTFAAICILWTIWSTPEMGDLGFIWRAVMASGPADIAVLVGIPLLVGALGLLFGGRQREGARKNPIAETKKDPFWRDVAMTIFGASAFILIAIKPALLTPISPQLSGLVQDVGAGIVLNNADSERLRRGYYEDLTDVNRFDNDLSAIFGGRPEGWNESVQSRQRTDAIFVDFHPSTVEEFKLATRTINSQGMRDREYSQAPSPETFRIALIGSSHDMGAGVGDSETYENLVEDRLNAELGPVTGLTYEILNFSHGGYAPTNKVAILEDRVLDFAPGLVLYASTTQDLRWVFKANQLQHLSRHGLIDQFPSIRAAMDRAGIAIDADEIETDIRSIRVELEPFAEDTLVALLERFRDFAQEGGAETALLILEVPDDSPERSPDFERLSEIGAAAGLPVVNLKGIFADIEDRQALWVAPWDAHPNSDAHQMIADLLFERLVSNGLVPVSEPVAE